MFFENFCTPKLYRFGFFGSWIAAKTLVNDVILSVVRKSTRETKVIVREMVLPWY